MSQSLSFVRHARFKVLRKSLCFRHFGVRASFVPAHVSRSSSTSTPTTGTANSENPSDADSTRRSIPVSSNQNAHHPVPSELLDANMKWTTAIKHSDPHFFKRSAQGQFPKILWLGCSDSRVPESVITASRPGDMFVHRNIANQVHPGDASVLSVVEFAVNYVKVEHVIVAGHTECAGINACLSSALKPGSKLALPSSPPDAPINEWLRPLLELARSMRPVDDTPLEALALVEASVKRQVDNICNMRVIRDAWAEGRDVKVHGWVHDVESGQLRDLKVTRGK